MKGHEEVVVCLAFLLYAFPKITTLDFFIDLALYVGFNGGDDWCDTLAFVLRHTQIVNDRDCFYQET